MISYTKGRRRFALTTKLLFVVPTVLGVVLTSFVSIVEGNDTR